MELLLSTRITSWLSIMLACSISGLVACSEASTSPSLRRVADLDGATSARFLSDDYFVTQVNGTSGELPVLLRRSEDGAVVADLGPMRCLDRFDCLIDVMPGGADRLVTSENEGDGAVLRRLSDGAAIRSYRWRDPHGTLFRPSVDGSSFVIGPGVWYYTGEPLQPSDASQLVDSHTGAEIVNLGAILWASFTSDGRLLFTRTMTTFEARDARSGQLVFKIEDPTPARLSQDGSTVAFESGKIINARTGAQISQMPPAIEIAEVSPDGSYVAVREARRRITGLSAIEGRYRDEDYAFIWSVRTNSVIKEFQDPQRSMSFALGSSRVVSKYCGSRTAFCMLTLTDTASGIDLRRLALGGGFLYDDRRLLVIHEGDGDRTVTSVNLSDGQTEYVSGASSRLDWGPDRSRANAEFFPSLSLVLYTFIPTSGDCPTLRADRLGQTSPSWEHSCVTEFAAIGSGHVLAATSDGPQVLLRVSDGQEVGSVTDVDLRSIQMSPDGATFILLCPSRTCTDGASLWRLPREGN